MKITIVEALEIGLECARQIASDTHEKYAGYKPQRHAAVDADVKNIEDVLQSLAVTASVEFDEEAERIKFEAWCWNEGPWSPNFFTERNELGDYVSEQTDGAWHAWLYKARAYFGIIKY